MKRFLLTLFIITINTLPISFANPPEDVSILQPMDTALQNDTAQNQWTRVTARFNPKKFLIDCDQEHHTEYSNLVSTENNNDDKNLIETCWKALFDLKNLYNQQINYENRIFSYQSMANLLLTYNIFPPNYKTKDEKHEFIIQLIDQIGYNVTPALAPEKHGKIKRWFRIYEGMLFLKYANEFALPKRRHRYIENAFYEFSEATRLKTTKTTYLLLAETILDYGHIPNGMTREAAEKLAYEYIVEAQKREKRLHQKKANIRPKEKLTTVEIHARPTYMNELNNKKATIQNNPMPLLPNGFLVTQDELADYDFTQLIIPRRQNIDGLIIRNIALNRVGALQENHIIDGHTFRRQNVAGDNMRCFFNAIGLNPDGQIAQLAFFANDPIVRYMIANEIVSTTANPDQIPAQVKEAINYNLYHTERTALDALENTRNALLLEQNLNQHLQNIQLLPEEYQNLGQRGEEILEQLRIRSLSLNAYNAFINHYIGNGEMMATLHDVQHNGNANYTSIDAIAYLENIGIKIVTPNEDGILMLIHEYIPQNAAEIAYIYRQGLHFQALLPVDNDNIILNEEQMDVEVENSSDFQIPTTEELRKLYPKVKTHCGPYDYNVDFVREILYTKEHLHKRPKEIGPRFGLDPRRVSEILIEHNIREYTYISNDIKEKILQSYLESYEDIKNKKITIRDLARAFHNKFKDLTNEKQCINLYEKLFTKPKIDDSIDEKEKAKIITLYMQGKSFFDIQKETGINLLTIISILSKKLDPKNYQKPINLIIKKETLSKNEKEDLIINTFNTLKNPSVLSVKNALKDYEIGYKTCERVLKRENLVPQNVKSKHLSQDIQEMIIEEFKMINPEIGKIQDTYNRLARKYDATIIQIRHLLTNELDISQGRKKSRENIDNVLNAYHHLGDKQKKNPINLIMIKTSLSKVTVIEILASNGLFSSNMKSCKKGTTILVENDNNGRKSIKRKREIEQDKPVKKKRKD
ncbi:MAG: hypothetical protein Q8S31_09650 [Alphaproteobacteria bacterium]|nr:hypothetical protein [Alphaproteobacteria bacterium]